MEAGTGHGALTLHLSRAIHGVNPAQPQLSPISKEADGQVAAENESENTNAMDLWKASRKAVIHTIDISPKYSKHAAKVVAGFRHGIYSGNVDFHVGDVSEWVASEFGRRNAVSKTPFLSHAFLDLPSTHEHVASVASALKTDGILIVFNPSITQIADCLQKIKRQGIPLFLDQTLELGNNGTSGGRPWDLRAVKPRAASKAQALEEASDVVRSPESETSGDQDQDLHRDSSQALTEVKPEDANWTYICRPKVGDRVVGGGFLGVFRKMAREN